MKNSIDPHYRSECPKSWETRSILSLGHFFQGAGFPEDLQGKFSEQYPFFKVSDFNLERNEKMLKDHSNSISEKTRKIIGAKIVPGGSVVFAKVGAALLLNRRRITVRDSIIDNNCAGLFPKKGIDLKFLFQTTCIIDFGNYVQPGAVPSINQNVLNKILIHLPQSIEEQQKITSILLTIDKAIEKTKALIEKNKQIKQGLMKDLFTAGLDEFGKPGKDLTNSKLGTMPKEWSIEHLSNCAYIIMGQSPDSSKCNEEGEGYSFLQGNAEFGELFPASKISCNAPKKVSHKGDILISVRAPVGDINIADKEYCIGRGLAAIRTFGKVHRDYLYYALLIYRNQLNILMQGTTFEAVNKNDISRIIIKVPDIREQKRIVDRIKLIDYKLRSEGHYLKKLEKIKSGLMQDLLTGKVRVKMAA